MKTISNYPPATVAAVLQDLEALGNPADAAGMRRFGITGDRLLGIKLPVLREYAKAYRRQHDLALALWETGVHEARLLAVFCADPGRVDEAMMEKWLRDFNSWDICDQACGLFRHSPLAHRKASEWTRREREFEKRAGFSLMATLAVHDKKALDEAFLAFFPDLLREAGDPRNFVKKALNWALRQIGKRNMALNQAAISLAESIREQGSASARWIAADALRELQEEATLIRISAKTRTSGQKLFPPPFI